jgi:hypothetical protein
VGLSEAQALGVLDDRDGGVGDIHADFHNGSGRGRAESPFTERGNPAHRRKAKTLGPDRSRASGTGHFDAVTRRQTCRTTGKQKRKRLVPHLRRIPLVANRQSVFSPYRRSIYELMF